MPENFSVTRRSLLKAGAAAAALGGSVTRLASGEDKNPYGGFRMGIQSYSLRNYDTEGALTQTRKFGLAYWESFNKHFPVTDSAGKIAEYRKLLDAMGIKLVAYGVQPFTKDTDANRKQFEFARAMGIQTLSADPTPDSFDNLDKLVEEYGINIAIHNHGPGARYAKIDDVLKAIRNHHERIGACVDTGHYLRSDVNAVEAIEAFGARTYDVHLKDVKKPDKFTVLGKGDLDLVGCLKALKKLKYDHLLALEYEEHPEDPIDEIQACLAAVRDAVKKVG